MKKLFRLIVFLAVTFTLFAVVVLVAFYHLIEIGEVRRFLISEVEDRTGLTVRLGDATLEWGWISGVSFRDVVVSMPQGAQPAITAERATARIALLPLLKRQIVVYQIRLDKPTARIERAKDGRVPLFDSLWNIKLPQEENGSIALELRRLDVNDGAIEFHDALAEGGPATTHFRAIEAHLEHMGQQALRDFIRDLRSARDRRSGPALDFSLQADLERGGGKAGLRVSGKMVFPEGNFELRSAWWDATVQLVGTPAAMARQLAGGWLSVKSLTGSLSPRVHLEGSSAEGLRVKGEVAFADLTIDAPEYFAGPLTPGDGLLEVNVEWSSRRLQLTQLALRSKEAWLSARGEIGDDSKQQRQLRLEVSAPPMPVGVLQKYLPLKLVDSATWQRYAASLEEGEIQIHRAGVETPLSAVNRSGADERIWFDAELRNVGANLSGDGHLPIHGVQGRVHLDRGDLIFKNLAGEYGRSRFSRLDGTYRLAGPGAGSFAVHLRGEADLAELREQINSRLISPRTTKYTAISELAGRGKVDLSMRRAADSPVYFEGKILLDGARVRLPDFSFTEIRGELSLTPQEIKAQRLRSVIAGAPVQIQLALKDYAEDNASFDLSVESTGIRAGIVTQMLLGSGTLQDPGIVRGAVRYQGPLGAKEGRKFTGSLDLINVQLSTEPLLQPLRELHGAVSIDEKGVDFQNMKGLLVGFPATFSGRWRYGQKPQLFFDFAAPNLDISYLISQIDPVSSAFYANLHAVGRVNIGQGKFKTFEFADLTSDLVLDRRVWRLSQFSTRSASGAIQGTATIADRPGALALSAESTVQGVPVQGFLNWLETKTTEMTGKVNLTGSLETVGENAAERERNLSGALKMHIEDGAIHRLRILVRILNLLDLSRWFTLQVPDLTTQGIRFRSITGDFKVSKGVLSTQNLFVDSDDLRMTGAGKIDLPSDEIDFVVAVRPFARLDTAINYIPLIGRGIAAIKNSFLVASFNIKGPIDDPTITPAPLSTLSEVFFGVLGIPKKLIPLGAEEKKPEPQHDTPPVENTPLAVP